MNQPPAKTHNGLHPAVEDFVHGVSETYKDRDELIASNQSLTNRAEVAEGMVEHLKAQLVAITADRDYYMRKAIEHATKLTASVGILVGMAEDLERETANPGPVKLVTQTGEQNAVDGPVT